MKETLLQILLLIIHILYYVLEGDHPSLIIFIIFIILFYIFFIILIFIIFILYKIKPTRGVQ